MVFGHHIALAKHQIEPGACTGPSLSTELDANGSPGSAHVCVRTKDDSMNSCDVKVPLPVSLSYEQDDDVINDPSLLSLMAGSPACSQPRRSFLPTLMMAIDDPPQSNDSLQMQQMQDQLNQVMGMLAGMNLNRNNLSVPTEVQGATTIAALSTPGSDESASAVLYA